MYLNFFGLSEKPFEDVPDPKFLYLGPSHHEALASLVTAIHRRLGLMVLTGAAGVGKSALLRAAAARLGEKDKLVQVASSDLPFDYLLAMALVELGASRPEEDLTGTEVIDRLQHYAEKQFANGGNLVFVIKDAQNFDNEAIQSLRDLSDAEIKAAKLVQVILSGTPELEANFDQLELGTFTDGINLRLHIYPLTKRETSEYIRHRLAAANCSVPGIFGRGALKMIWKYTGGVPQKINLLCDAALGVAYGMGRKRIDAGIVEQAAAELGWEPSSQDFEFSTPAAIGEHAARRAVAGRSRFRLGLGGGLGAALAVVFAAWLFWGGSETNRTMEESTRVSAGTRAEVKGKSEGAERSVAVVRRPIEIKQDQGTEAASEVSEVTETVTRSEEAPIVEREQPTPLVVPGNEAASEEAIETVPEAVPKAEAETAVAAPETVLPSEAKPPAESVEADGVRESPDAGVKTASAPPAKPQAAVEGKWVFQLGAFREKRYAEDLKRTLAAKGYDAYLVESEPKAKGIRYRVRLRCCSNAAEGRAVKARLSEQGFGDAFVVARSNDSGEKGD